MHQKQRDQRNNEGQAITEDALRLLAGASATDSPALWSLVGEGTTESETFSQFVLDRTGPAVPIEVAIRVLTNAAVITAAARRSDMLRSLSRKMLIRTADRVKAAGHLLPDDDLDSLTGAVARAHFAQWSGGNPLTDKQAEKLAMQLIGHYQSGRGAWVGLDTAEYLRSFSDRQLKEFAELLEGREFLQLAPLRLAVALAVGGVDAAFGVLGGRPEAPGDVLAVITALSKAGMTAEAKRLAEESLEAGTFEEDDPWFALLAAAARIDPPGAGIVR